MTSELVYIITKQETTDDGTYTLYLRGHRNCGVQLWLPQGQSERVLTCLWSQKLSEAKVFDSLDEVRSVVNRIPDGKIETSRRVQPGRAKRRK